MPDVWGKLTESELEQIKKWLRDTWKNFKCPFSYHNDWEIGEQLVQAAPWAMGNYSLASPAYPYVVIMCQGCGYSIFINAIRIGIDLTPTQYQLRRTPEP